jgi:3-dehydroquinate synthase
VKAIHDIIIGSHALDSLNQMLGTERKETCFIITDHGVAKSCLDYFLYKVAEARDAVIIEIPSGDENKNTTNLIRIWHKLLEHSNNTKPLILNLGGGMVSDIGGFAAGTFNRGVDYYNIPTTLLAMVDASIGGKTAINIENVKNKAGVFALPAGVFIDSYFLKTLNQQHYLSGLAEAFKTLIVGDEVEWKWLQSEFMPGLENLDPLIEKAAKIKQRIVSLDFFDKNVRKSLNFGHTMGHALESIYFSKNQSLTHGEAVAAGMIMELYLSHQVSGLHLDTFIKICSFLNKYFKPIEIEEADIGNMISVSKKDKKNFRGSRFLSLLQSPGKPDVNALCSEDQILEAIKFYRDLYRDDDDE